MMKRSFIIKLAPVTNWEFANYGLKYRLFFHPFFTTLGVCSFLLFAEMTSILSATLFIRPSRWVVAAC